MALVRVGEQAGRLDDDVDAQRLPGQRGRAFLDGQALDLVAVDDQHVVLGDVGADFSLRDGAGETALGRIVLQQVGEVVGRNDVVDGDHVDLLAQQSLIADCPEHQPADAAEAVDANTNCHSTSPLEKADPVGPNGHINRLSELVVQDKKPGL